ncbi:putative monocarboxylate permease [Aspergillus clavatus NRRL 1]|uniref:Monocarboxylate permease, putative n=1 Tax=Aspergillus clavatus (strain ATCC 1007 / CBS 513.65 / DSM 816 / NCTC 3887 / NRRL 1 / QM 1276 / 107) TaxID=344612 RepID=A1CLK4_ASPCL|nr:monocarboxylate permease, putative [Aspergillus clavatus NRRL 1]EAW10028.1 monocarboxylate permease, putative [Aspergillus clavatus NRRL 1]
MSTDHARVPEEVDPHSESDYPNDVDAEKDISPQAPPGWNKTNPPDGGITAWLVILGAWSVLFCSFGWINSVGIFQNYYEKTLLRQYSASTIAWIPSLQIFFMYAMGPVVGRLYDTYGARYLILVGSLLHVFGLMMCSISKEYYQVLLSQGVCSAIGVSIIFQPAISVVPDWFDKRRGAAYGIVSSGSSVGGVIFPIMIERFIPEVGFGWAMRIGGFLILLLLIIANLTIRSRLPPSPQSLTRAALSQPFRDSKMVLVIVGFMLLTFGVFIIINYLVVEALSQGMGYDLAQYLLAILNAGSLFGCVGAGVLADHLGAYNIFVSVCYLAGILILALWIPAAGNAAIIAFAVLFGFASGAYVALAAALVVKISPFQQIGYRIGLIFLFASVSGLTTNPIAGAILADNNGSYIGMKIFAGVLLLVGTTLVFAARLKLTGFRLIARF